MQGQFLINLWNIITEIRIEYAPDPLKALKDKTSFDVFIEYRHASGGSGILGIEVKYTEQEYKLKEKSKEEKEMKEPTSIYYTLTDKIGLYRKEIIQKLPTDEFRQVWRNQLLGESMTRKNYPDSKYEYFTSIILYPKGNTHFRELVPTYKSFLTLGHENSFKGTTYEEFISVARGLTVDPGYLDWLQYLEDRYIVSNQ
jgi:hypothetical protein